MDLKIAIRTLELLKKLSSKKIEDIEYVKYTPQKVQFPQQKPYRQAFKRTTPEAQGINSEYLCSFLEELQQIPETCVHSLMIIRNGAVIAEGAFDTYKEDMWHISHSLCKSVVSLAVGMAVDEGLLKLDDKIGDILKDRKPILKSRPRKGITIRHLLTMTSGIMVNETVGVTGNEWVRSCLESTQRFEPGKKFHYNSMNTYLLSAAVCKVSKQGLMEYLTPRLWDPLGIDRIMWELSPEGIEKGGWGMYICVEDMAKLGQLYLQNGMWEGKQLVSESWIKDASTNHVNSASGKGRYGYGYQVWMGKCPGSYLFNGMLGQIVYILPKYNMVLALTGGSSNLYRDSETNLLIERYFDGTYEPAEELPDDPKACRRLKKICGNLRYNQNISPDTGIKEVTLLPPTYHEIEAQALEIEDCSFKITAGIVGLLPLFIQCVHNNYSKGITRLGLRWKDKEFLLLVKEGKNINKIPIGFGEAKYSDIIENGETFQVASEAVIILNEDDNLVIKISLAFIETANTRIIKLIVNRNKVTAQFFETPGIEMMLNGIESVVSTGTASNLVSGAVAMFDEDYILFRLRKAFEPMLELEPVIRKESNAAK